MGRLIGLLAAALLTVGCAGVSVQDFEQHYVTEEHFNFACESVRELGYKDVDCSAIPRPVLVLSEVVEAMTPYGYTLYGFVYDNEYYIFVNPNHPVEQINETTVHETAHYILFQTYGEGVSRCDSEYVARIVGAKWSQEEYSEDWRQWYNCPA